MKKQHVCPKCGRKTPVNKKDEICWWCQKGIILPKRKG